MNFKQFHSSIVNAVSGADVVRQSYCYGRRIVETADVGVLVDGAPTNFSSLEEAQDHFRQHKIQQDIREQIQKELYEEMSDNKVADIIRKHHGDVRVTDTLIESYMELASSKSFTVNPVAQDIRQHNRLDSLVEGCVDFVLNDGTRVVVSESAQQKLNTILAEHQDVVDYMRTSKDNFLNVVNQLED